MLDPIDLDAPPLAAPQRIVTRWLPQAIHIDLPTKQTQPIAVPVLPPSIRITLGVPDDDR